MRRILPLVPVLAFVALVAGPSPRAEEGAARARVATKEEGFLRVRAATLKSLGLGPAAEVAVSRRGRAVPAFARGEDLVFLSVDPGSDSSASSVFELERVQGRPGAAPRVATGEVPEPKPFHSTRVLSADRVYGEVAAAEPEVYGAEEPLPVWYLARVPASGKVELPLDPAGAEAGAAQQMVLKVVGTHTGVVALSARWGDRDLGTAEAPSAAGGAALSWTVPAAAVPAKEAPLVLSDASPPPPPKAARDVSDDRGAIWVDEVALSGPVAPEAGGRLLRVRATEGPSSLRVPDPAAEVNVAGRTADGAPLPPLGAVAREGRVLLPGGLPAGAEIFVSTRVVDVAPVPAPPRADPLASAGAAQHVILATGELLPDARRLAEHRTRTGLPSAVVPVSEVYDAYAVGEPDGQAVRDFLLALMARESAPLRFVVLAGDATLDRTDLAATETIPVRMARTKYNGATPSDRLYGRPPGDLDVGGASVGRLPFRRAEEMKAYVDRVVEYETRPPADATRRTMRFVTGEGHFGAALDAMIEGYFGKILSDHIPDAYDVEVTYARADSAFSWPAPEFGAKVVDGLNAGALVYSYVGHGHVQGFDSMWVGDRRFPILSVREAPQVEVKGTLPAVLVLACSTGAFDLPDRDGIGEALLKRPRGPIAYFGATRICHPATNGLLGRSISMRVFEDPERRRVGEILDAARDEVLDPQESSLDRTVIVGAMRMFAPGEDLDRILLEGAWMYGLLGDPAVRFAMPEADLAVDARLEGGRVLASVRGPLPDGAVVAVSLELPRNEMVAPPREVGDPLDPASFPVIRENHRRANDKRVASGDGTAKGGVARVEIAVPEGTRPGPLLVKASAVAEGAPRVGSARVELP